MDFDNTSDQILWKWTKNGRFSVKSTYDHLTNNESGKSCSRTWKAKIPYKIKIFLWLLEQGEVPTKDNMRKRNWNGDPTCRFCAATETVDHLFFQCPIAKVTWGIGAHSIGANNIPININQYFWVDIHLPKHKHFHAFGLAAICWATWKARNRACFDHKLIKHPAEIVCHACAFMNFWTGLHKTNLQAQVMEGVKILLANACRILANQR